MPLDPPAGVTVTPGAGRPTTLAGKEALYFDARAAYLADHPPVAGDPPIPPPPRAFVPLMPGTNGGVTP